MDNFTPEDLIMYLYNEINEEMRINIENRLAADWALREKLQVLKESLTRLGKAELLSPRQKTVQAVLQYATVKKARV
jgi:hypothetical protein